MHLAHMFWRQLHLQYKFIEELKWWTESLSRRKWHSFSDNKPCRHNDPLHTRGCYTRGPHISDLSWRCVSFTGEMFSVRIYGSISATRSSWLLLCSDKCWSPLGVQTLPASSFSASSQQAGHPPEAGRLHWWDPHRDLQVHCKEYCVNCLWEIFLMWI